MQTLRSAIGKVVEYREEFLKSSTDFGHDKTTAMYVSVDNKRIGDLEQMQESVCLNFFNKKERDRVRKIKNQDVKDPVALAEDEAEEEQEEVIRMVRELQDKDLFDQKQDIEAWHKDDDAKNNRKGKVYFERQ